MKITKLFFTIALSFMLSIPSAFASSKNSDSWQVREIQTGTTTPAIDEAFVFNSSNELFGISLNKGACDSAHFSFVVPNLINVSQQYKAITHGYIVVDDKYTSLVKFEVVHSKNDSLSFLRVVQFYNGADNIVSKLGNGSSITLNIVMNNGDTVKKTFTLKNAAKALNEALLMCNSTNT